MEIEWSLYKWAYYEGICRWWTYYNLSSAWFWYLLCECIFIDSSSKGSIFTFLLYSSINWEILWFDCLWLAFDLWLEVGIGYLKSFCRVRPLSTVCINDCRCMSHYLIYLSDIMRKELIKSSPPGLNLVYSSDFPFIK